MTDTFDEARPYHQWAQQLSQADIHEELRGLERELDQGAHDYEACRNAKNEAERGWKAHYWTVVVELRGERTSEDMRHAIAYERRPDLWVAYVDAKTALEIVESGQSSRHKRMNALQTFAADLRSQV